MTNREDIVKALDLLHKAHAALIDGYQGNACRHALGMNLAESLVVDYGGLLSDALQSGWRSDMENAPRDEVEILIFGGKYHHEASGGEYTADIDRPVIAWRHDDHFVIANTSGFSQYTVQAPTHWMPLPPPPQDKTPNNEGEM